MDGARRYHGARETVNGPFALIVKGLSSSLTQGSGGGSRSLPWLPALSGRLRP